MIGFLLEVQNYIESKISGFSKVLLLFLFLIGHGFSVWSQQINFKQKSEFLKANSVWAFGDSAGLDLNSGNPIPILTAMHNDFGNEGFASVADPITGKLLFYSNGGKCWTANHQLMPNGDKLFGNGTSETNGFANGGFSTIQGVCIVPFIDSPGKYYLFSLMGVTNTPMFVGSGKNGILFYSVVDMNLNNGLGDIEQGRKNIVLDYNLLSEGMIAIPGDHCDVWLMTHTYDKSEFKAYQITNNGIHKIPVISNTGNVLMGPSAYGMSSMAVSSDRQKIAISSSAAPLNFVSESVGNGVLMGEFNPGTGEVTNAIKVLDWTPWSLIDPKGPGLLQPHGICFSPDNSKLYVGTQYVTSNNGSFSLTTRGIFQFEISVYDSLAISNSRTLIANSENIYAMRNYKDVIYIDVFQKDKNLPSFLHRINKPNLSGAASDFEASAIRLLPRTNALAGLGNDVVYPLTVDTLRQMVLDTTLCLDQSILLSSSSSINGEYLWEDGSKEQNRRINKPGVYWLTYNETFCQAKTDSFLVKELTLAPVITININELGTTEPYATYQWLFNGVIITGATQRTYIVTKNGDYQVIVTNENGCIASSEIYKVTNQEDNANRIGNYNTLANQIRFYPNPAHHYIQISSPVEVSVKLMTIEGKLILQQNQAKVLSLKNIAPGMYLIQIINKEQNIIKSDKILIL